MIVVSFIRRNADVKRVLPFEKYVQLVFFNGKISENSENCIFKYVEVLQKT
jgi:hypothetical protein